MAQGTFVRDRGIGLMDNARRVLSGLISQALKGQPMTEYHGIFHTEGFTVEQRAAIRSFVDDLLYGVQDAPYVAFLDVTAPGERIVLRLTPAAK